MNKSIKKLFSICTILVLTLCLCLTAVAQVDSFTDFPDDWSAPAMKYAVEKGLIKGYPDNTIRADVDITRAEMAAVVNRAYGAFIKATKLPFIDVEEGKWFEDTVKIAYNMGTVMGDGNTMRPDDPITREEAFVILARAYSKTNDDVSNLEAYKDYEDIKSWSKEYLSFLSGKGYINGFEDGNLYPDANLTRAELSQVFYNMITEYLSSQEALDSSDVYDGNIIINGSVTKIVGKTFNGDLVIGDGVGTNKVIVKDTVVKGTLIIRGAQEIRFINTKVIDNIIVNNPNNTVHFDNYITDLPFKGIETKTLTEATWKKPVSSSGGSGGSGGTTKYEVTFETNGGSAVAKQTIKEGKTATKPADPTKTGYTFAGWFTDNTTFVDQFDFSTPITEPITLYANWTADEYSITISGAEGSNEFATLPTGHTYDTATNVPNLTKTGYDFLGWVVNGTGNPVKDLVLGATDYTDDITLTAKWEAQTYDISFAGTEGATVEGTLPTGHTYDTATTVPNLTKTGYDFLGWEINGAGAPVKDLVLGATDYIDDITLKAVWQAQTYTISYVDVAGANEIATLPTGHTYDATTTLPNLTKTGYDFLGWEINGAGTPVKDLVLGATDYTDDITLTAKWEAQTYDISFAGTEGATVEGTLPTGHTYNTATNVPNLTKTGYDFLGWEINGAGAPVKDLVLGATDYTDDITLTAKWEVQTYDITYVDIEKATYEGTLPTTHTYNTATTVQNVTRTGYDFLGWEINGAGAPVKDLVLGATDYTDDITLKAVWQAQTYTINYVDIAGANEIATLPEDHTYDTATNVPNLTKEKFRFLGWVVNGTGAPVKDLVLGATDYTDVITLTAKWQETVTVTFDTNGGSDIDEQTIDKGTKATKPADPKKGALIFGGWYTDNNTFANEFDFTTEIQEDITLYAKWNVVVKFYNGSAVDEDELLKELTITAKTKVSATEVPIEKAEYGYYRNGTLSSVYVGEETEHKIDFKWYIKNSNGNWELYNFDTLVEDNIALHIMTKEANLFVNSDKELLDGIQISAPYNDETPVYESVLDVIFANKNLVETKYDSVEQKEKVINKLIEKGIIDENYNILNQDRFVKFSIVGKERLGKFVRDNVKKQLTYDTEESINSYLDHLIDKNDGSAESTLREVFDKELNSEGRDVVLDVIEKEITKIIDNDNVKFASYIDDYIVSRVEANDTDSAKALLETHIKTLLTEGTTKEFADNMTTEQVKAFVKYYIDLLTDDEIDDLIEEKVGSYVGERDEALNTVINQIMADIEADKTAAYPYIEDMFDTQNNRKEEAAVYLTDKLIEDPDFRDTNLQTAVNMIVGDPAAKASVKATIINYVTTDADALNAAVDVAITEIVTVDEDARYDIVEEFAHLIEEHPELMEEILDFAYESKFGVYVNEFERELNEEDKFTVNEDNLFIMEAILKTADEYTYEDVIDKFVPEKIRVLIPEDTLKNLYDTAYNDFKGQLKNAIEVAENGGVEYVDSGVNIEFNPMTEVVIPVFDYYNDLADGKLKDFYYYADNKYLQALIEKINPENLFDKTTETEKLSGYKVMDFGDYYEWFKAVSVLTADTGRWYAENLPKDKAEAAQDKLAVKLTDYFNSVLALLNQYSDTKILPSYVDVLDIFENDIPDRFKDKYESLLDLAESRIDIDDTIDKVYDKLAEKGIVSKFNTVLDKFIASKYNREITEENIPAIYNVFRKLAGYDDYYTLDSAFNVAKEHLTRFEVAEDKYQAEKAGTMITVEKIYR